MNTKENINELMVAIEEVLGIKIDWMEEDGSITIDRTNLTIIVVALERLLVSVDKERRFAKNKLEQSRTGQK